MNTAALGFHGTITVKLWLVCGFPLASLFSLKLMLWMYVAIYDIYIAGVKFNRSMSYRADFNLRSLAFVQA